MLWERLDVSTQGAVTIVVAPAGAGKTLGVAGWLQHSADGRDAASWISGSKSVSRRQLETALHTARRDDDVPRLVVIDDAHLLPSTCVRFLDHALDQDPGGIRLLLLTRWDLALSRLVPELLGHLSVIRGDVLKLSEPEARQLIAEHARTNSPAVRDAIVGRARGWCAAVVLAARASAAAPSHDDFIRRCADTGLGVADLVAGEVFDSLPSRERHLLLCTAFEPVLTSETAIHLTRDPLAGEALSTLESTGVLVTRVGVGHPQSDDGDLVTERVRYRIHPLLLEVTRRQLVMGGPDVQHAHSMVLRAARLDLARGDIADGFRRLVALGEYDDAAEVLAQHGPRLLASGNAPYVEDFVRRAGTMLEQKPLTWGAIACARWMSGDALGAVHWSSRLLSQHALAPGSVPVVQASCLRLRQSRVGLEPVLDAVIEARDTVGQTQPSPGGDPFRAMLLLELGAAENWLGDLTAAEHHLSESVMASRTEQLLVVTAEALTHLALTQYMAGRESACQDLAEQAIGLCDGDASIPPATRARAEVALRLVALQSAPWQVHDLHAPVPEVPSVPDDLAGRFWHRVLLARLALVSGAVAEAVRQLSLPFEMPALPEHLQINLSVERALHGLTAGNREALRASADALAALDATAEHAWAEGALADLEGDLRRAATLYLEASRSVARLQPATATLGLVGAAQLHRHLADAPPIGELLRAALTATEPRRNALPFLGWSPHGTHVAILLTQEGDADASAWGVELRDALLNRPGVTSIFRPLVATPRELGSVAEPAVTPTLSPREQEVLGELARGSTYADIAANLFVSENTVKTHISSIYTKLSAGRRSEALAVARKLHLL